MRLWSHLRRWFTAHHGLPVGALRDVGFLAVDLETTGLDTRRDTIVALAAIPFVSSEPLPGFVTLVDPGRPIPAASTAIHGLTDRMVAGAPSVDRVIGDLDGLFDGRIVVGHGVDFDLTIINRERGLRGLPRLANPALDTQRLAAVICPQWRDYSLETVAARLGVEVVGRHTAPGDALAAGRVLLALLPLLEGDGVRTVSELVWLQRRPIVR
ncbi:MAG TPA: 3'-5' exonuclease [Methylomirabilota bacterium]